MTDGTAVAGAGESASASAVLGSPETPTGPGPRRELGQARWIAAIFIGPALVLLAAVLLYPLVYSGIRSLFQDAAAGKAGSFVWFRNYGSVFTDHDTFRAVKNNLIWLAVAPTVITIVGLMFAVLSERVRWATAFKLVLFMPMAISFLASGVTFALIYSDQPSRGLANAVSVGIHDTFYESGKYPDEHSRPNGDLTGSPQSGFTTTKSYSPGQPVLIPMVGLSLTAPPKGLQSAALPSGGSGLSGVIWNDFRKGGGGTLGQPDPGELGLNGMKVQAVQNGKVVASATANAQGQFAFPKLDSGSYQMKLPAVNFKPPYNGISWLGPNFITWAIMIAYLWVYAGFAMVLLAAGMSAIPRDALEAARIDGATEWQVFRRVTAPLLAPVLLVVFVTLVINVLKIFDIVFVLSQGAGGNGKYANVLATQLYNAYGQLHYGIASAIGVLLVLIVVPFMALNVRRFRREQQ
ncbi:MAG: alpha-glucoside transport system permease protein [Pseudonocardiales bacterium]|jgi:ABC-type sugar transport system permease subunit|nr:alpha-glucoside transport system permease protein [Pseudonocardiales bacterium]